MANDLAVLVSAWQLANYRLTGAYGLYGWRIVRDNFALGKVPIILGKIDCGQAQLIGRFVEQGNGSPFGSHDGSDAARDSPQQLRQVEVRSNSVTQVKQHFEPVFFPLQGLKVEGVIHGERHTVGHERKKFHFCGRISVRLLAAYGEAAHLVMCRSQGKGADGANSLVPQ